MRQVLKKIWQEIRSPILAAASAAVVVLLEELRQILKEKNKKG